MTVLASTLALMYDRPVAHPTIPTEIDCQISATANGLFPAMFGIMFNNQNYAHHDIIVVGDETFQFVDPTILNRVSNDSYIAVYLLISATQRNQAMYLACSLSGKSQGWPLGVLPLLSGGVGNAKVSSSHTLVVYCESIDLGGGSSFLSIINCFNGIYSGSTFGNAQQLFLGSTGNGQPNNFKGGVDQIPPTLTNNHGAVFFPSASPDNSGAGQTVNGSQSTPLEWADGKLNVTIQADADERSIAVLTGDLFRVEITPSITSPGLVNLGALVTPRLGTGVDFATPTLINCDHPENMDTWQTEIGRPRQDYNVDPLIEEDPLLFHGEAF